MTHSDTNTSRNVQVGPGLLGTCVLASIVLAILKLTNVWAITWFIVLLPTIVGIGFTIVTLVVAIIAVVVLELFSGN